jgi:DNA-directed RNA polymerase subunit RPC12/RpoP
MAEHKLPIEYVCRKCNKIYSNQEYEQSRFCRVCGSFLLRNFRDDRYAQMLAQKSFGNQTSATGGTGSFKEKIALTRAAESLSERIVRSKEYEVISETEKTTEHPAESACSKTATSVSANTAANSGFGEKSF